MNVPPHPEGGRCNEKDGLSRTDGINVPKLEEHSVFHR